MMLRTSHVGIIKDMAYVSSTKDQCCRTTSWFAVLHSLVANNVQCLCPSTRPLNEQWGKGIQF